MDVLGHSKTDNARKNVTLWRFRVIIFVVEKQ